MYIDTIGELGLRDNRGNVHSFYASTMIDPATGIFEIRLLTTKTMKEVADIFNTKRICCYPRLKIVICDKGGEFKKEFKTLGKSYDIKVRPVSRKNAQANRIIERAYLVLQNMILTFNLQSKN